MVRLRSLIQDSLPTTEAARRLDIDVYGHVEPANITLRFRSLRCLQLIPQRVQLDYQHEIRANSRNIRRASDCLGSAVDFWGGGNWSFLKNQGHEHGPNKQYRIPYRRSPRWEPRCFGNAQIFRAVRVALTGLQAAEDEPSHDHEEPGVQEMVVAINWGVL